MKIRTTELTGAALDYAAALFDHDHGWLRRQLTNPNPETRAIPRASSEWYIGGPLIERERIETYYTGPLECWAAKCDGWLAYGPTPLIAAMRAYVVSKIGAEVDVPEELL